MLLKIRPIFTLAGVCVIAIAAGGLVAALNWTPKSDKNPAGPKFKEGQRVRLKIGGEFAVIESYVTNDVYTVYVRDTSGGVKLQTVRAVLFAK